MTQFEIERMIEEFLTSPVVNEERREKVIVLLKECLQDIKESRHECN